ncbi:DNA (cytosine-5-)-methyltransferase [Salinivibrio kushneri]|uniref:Cytosine-specific methyltransferase n=1 Tax=Salinivibrio kushneri TaxID=1908198 RepID=A0AB36K001_9GAMM|nr:DNA (cytosine-5-)-methyltransferase [Salinivibrio kushneri]OOE40043.1 DNA (cytosine-5-)-methyltransferase [Salinivibrio kushneri]QCP01056.1 DNA cytosine methyltransferase [Salinivibrio kushneri]
MRADEILVIDLFAGPGGLGEGISSVTDENGYRPFKIGLSVEKESSAHLTLTTRALYRKLKENKQGLQSYHDYLCGQITREKLFDQHPEEAEAARTETLYKPRALGDDNEFIHERIKQLVNAHGNRPKIVIGGPPCQAYSLVGRSRNAGIKDYKAETDKRNFLYKEYLKVLSIAQPDVFVMENVRGILSAKVKDKPIFPQMLKDLRNPEQVTAIHGAKYNVYSLVKPANDPANPDYDKTSDFLIKAEDYGVPQARHRVILLGVREDIDKYPDTLLPSSEHVTVEQAISDLPKLRSGLSKQKDDNKAWEKIVERHAKTVKRLLSKSFSNTEELDLKPRKGLSRSSKDIAGVDPKVPRHLWDWYIDNKPKCVLNHETRAHMESDLLRYAYSSAYTYLSGGSSPKSKSFPDQLAPAHGNWKTGAHDDRFRTQAANKCSTTVTSHMSKDGHYFIHYDPKQCRSLTVREAARLQTFPDNYKFEGNRTQQYVQVGNAVPPYLAQQIGKVVLELLR